MSIICKRHGEFFKDINGIRKDKMCPKCYYETVNVDKRMNEKDFIDTSNSIHEYKYNYDKTEYINSRILVTVTCPIHGDFEQRPSSHMRGRGCKRCAREYNSFKKTDYVNRANGRNTILYLIRCWNEKEEFLKIGKTFRSVKERFNSTLLMPYNYEIINEIIADASYIWDLEMSLHKRYKEHSYKPLVKFGGMFECYGNNLPINEIIEYKVHE